MTTISLSFRRDDCLEVFVLYPAQNPTSKQSDFGPNGAFGNGSFSEGESTREAEKYSLYYLSQE